MHNNIGSIKFRTGELHYYLGDVLEDDNVVFVFGSNPEGRHGAGAAKVAVQKFGAKYGQAEGIQGNAYAIPTKDLRHNRSIPKEQIIASIKNLYKYARLHPEQYFMIAYRNGPNQKSLCFYSGKELQEMFIAACEGKFFPDNIVFSTEWSFSFERDEDLIKQINQLQKNEI